MWGKAPAREQARATQPGIRSPGSHHRGIHGTRSGMRERSRARTQHNSQLRERPSRVAASAAGKQRPATRRRRSPAPRPSAPASTPPSARSRARRTGDAQATRRRSRRGTGGTKPGAWTRRAPSCATRSNRGATARASPTALVPQSGIGLEWGPAGIRAAWHILHQSVRTSQQAAIAVRTAPTSSTRAR